VERPLVGTTHQMYRTLWNGSITVRCPLAFGLARHSSRASCDAPERRAKRAAFLLILE
jgi:hypothetical protein